MDSYNFLTEIQQQTQVERTYSGGGHPHTFVELFGGHTIPMLNVEPDILSFRLDYYYNSSDNNLYIKRSGWENVDRQFDTEDSSYVYYDGRSVKKMVNEPDPKEFGDQYYYNIVSNKVLGRILKWVKCTNL